MTANFAENGYHATESQSSYDALDSSAIKKGIAVLAMGSALAASVMTGKAVVDVYQDLQNPDYKIQVIDGISG